jgi:hypothetical protein
MLAALARSLGIPVKLGSRAGHGYVEFPRIKRFVHGDMIALPAAWPGEWIVNDQQTWDMKDPYVYYRNQFPQESRLKYLLMMIAPRFVGDDQWRVESSITILTRREQYSQCMMTREEVMRYKDVIAAVFPEFQLKFTNDGCERTVDDAGRFTGDLPHAHADALYRVTSEPIKIKSLEEYYAPQYFVSSTVGHL